MPLACDGSPRSSNLESFLVGELVSIGTLFAFAIVCASVLVLRIGEPALPRPFKTPAVYVVAPAGVISAVFLMIGLPIDTWIRLAVWLGIGLVIYFLYGRTHSRVGANSSGEHDRWLDRAAPMLQPGQDQRADAPRTRAGSDRRTAVNTSQS